MPGHRYRSDDGRPAKKNDPRVSAGVALIALSLILGFFSGLLTFLFFEDWQVATQGITTAATVDRIEGCFGRGLQGTARLDVSFYDNRHRWLEGNTTCTVFHKADDTLGETVLVRYAPQQLGDAPTVAVRLASEVSGDTTALKWAIFGDVACFVALSMGGFLLYRTARSKKNTGTKSR